MGQAVLDLPDPMEKPPAGGNADDLLSQLAGDEIDRLLGEAEVDKAAAEEAAAAEAPAVDVAAPTEPVAEAAVVEPPTDMAAMLEEAQTDAPNPSVSEPVVEVTPPAAASDLDQTIAAHADTVLGPSPTAEPERADLLTDIAHADSDEAPSLPLLLRPLEWFSSPLDTLSPTARDFLGKAAIVALVNSAAVIAYVIWFRK